MDAEIQRLHRQLQERAQDALRDSQEQAALMAELQHTNAKLQVRGSLRSETQSPGEPVRFHFGCLELTVHIRVTRCGNGLSPSPPSSCPWQTVPRDQSP
jgi:hypothetical protein